MVINVTDDCRVRETCKGLCKGSKLAMLPAQGALQIWVVANGRAGDRTFLLNLGGSALNSPKIKGFKATCRV